MRILKFNDKPWRKTCNVYSKEVKKNKIAPKSSQLFHAFFCSITSRNSHLPYVKLQSKENLTYTSLIFQCSPHPPAADYFHHTLYIQAFYITIPTMLALPQIPSFKNLLFYPSLISDNKSYSHNKLIPVVVGGVRRRNSWIWLIHTNTWMTQSHSFRGICQDSSLLHIVILFGILPILSPQTDWAPPLCQALY